MKRSAFLSHGLLTGLITILVLLIYATVQQSYRTGANDPQLEMAGDVCERIADNRSIDHSMADDTIDITRSLATFTVLYDANGEAVRSTGWLDGKMPGVPKGVFEYTRMHNEDVLTWQPRGGIRIALVVRSVRSSGSGIAFVAVGRSLKEVEKRISNLSMTTLVAWFACLGLILLHWLIYSLRKKDI